MTMGKGSKKKKGGKRKAIEPMTRKEWVKLDMCSFKNGALRPFTNHKGSWTIVNRSSGKKSAKDALMGSQFEIRADDRDRDMTQDDHASEASNPVFFVVKYKVVAVKDDEKACACVPYGVRPTKGFVGEKLRKRHTTIDTCVDFTTADGYKVRVLVKAITKRQQHSIKNSAYAKSSQVVLIRNKIRETTKAECENKCLADIVDDMVSARSLSETLETATVPIYPLHSEFMFWLKVLKEPSTKFHYHMMSVDADDREADMEPEEDEGDEDVDDVEA